MPMDVTAVQAQHGAAVATQQPGYQTVAVTADAPRRGQVLNVQATPRFYLKWKPGRYMLIDGELRPYLSKLTHAPGMNGIHGTKPGMHPDPTPAVVRSQQNGDVVLLFGACPAEFNPQGDATYLSGTRCRNGFFHHTVWEQPYRRGSQVVTRRVRHDLYVQWLDWLMDHGPLRRPNEEELELYIERLEGKAHNLRRTHDREGEMLRQSKVAEERAAAIRSAQAEPQPKPKRSRSKGASSGD